MKYEKLVILSYIAAVVSVIFLAIAVVLFFKLKIKNVIGDLSGANQKKAIESIKASNKSNAKKSSFSNTNLTRSNSNTSVTKNNNSLYPTNKNSENNQIPSSEIPQLGDDGVTEVLGINALDDSGEIDNETSVLGSQSVSDENDDNVTSVLGVQAIDEECGDNETSVLGIQSAEKDVDFEDSITFVHGKTIR